jgi:hypothetical protein
VLPEFSAQKVTLDVLEHLERRRQQIVDDEARVRDETKQALVLVRKAYQEAELPMPYWDAVEAEVLATVPGQWRSIAAPYTDREKREFGLWRGGDPVARITYVFLGLVVGGLCVELPFIPIWEKWFPFVLALAAWWLPNAQVAFHKRRYSRRLGAIAARTARVQAQLDGTVTTESLLLPDKGDSRE